MKGELTQFNKAMSQLSNKNISEDIKDYLNNEVTSDTAKDIINTMYNLHTQLDNSNLDDSTKDNFKTALSLYFSEYLGNHCKSKLIENIVNKSTLLKKRFIEMKKNYQRDMEEYNKLAKKYNEQEKKAEIPDLNLTVSLKSKKLLTTKECLELSNILEEEELDDNIKRISIKNLSLNDNIKSKIKRVYAGKSDEPVIKQLQPK